MEWDLCSSAHWVPFCPYTMFQNPMYKHSSQKLRKTVITQKVLVTQSSNIVHCDQHCQNLYVQNLKAFQTLFPVKIDIFYFLSGGVKQISKNSHFAHFDWEKASKWLEWHTYRVRGMPNQMALVWSLYDKWFLPVVTSSFSCAIDPPAFSFSTYIVLAYFKFPHILRKFFAFKKLKISGPKYNLLLVLATRYLYGGTSD